MYPVCRRYRRCEDGVGACVNPTILSETLQFVGITEVPTRVFRLVKKKTMNLCVFDSEEREHGVGAGVNGSLLSETLQLVGIPEVAGRVFRFRKKTMNLCV